MEWKKVVTQPKVLLLLVVAGVLLLMGNWIHPQGQPNQPTQAPGGGTAAVSADASPDAEISQMEKSYEARLASMLNQMQGVSDATVLVNIQSTEEVTIASDGSSTTSTTQEKDTNGGIRTTNQTTQNNQVVMNKGASGGDVPVIVKKTKPPITGVWVEARGVNNPVVQNQIVSAIVHLLDIPAYRISITEK